MNAALVLGLSIHGLAVCRALAKEGVPTFAISSEPHPAARTRFADVTVDPAVNSPDLVRLLKDLGPRLAKAEKVVLFATNDTMVREIGKSWSELDRWFLTSWSPSISRVLQFQLKSALPAIAEAAGVHHPTSVLVRNREDINQVSHKIGYPCIVKPAVPLSSFKVKIMHSEGECIRDFERWVADLPIVAQELVDGSDSELLFYSSLWNSGKELGAFTGRKVHAIPPGLGQGTAMEGKLYEDVLEAGRRLSLHLNVNGPVAIEFKRDSCGRLVMIEPNVGRSEYCVDLLIQSGFNLPYMEYLVATKKTVPIPHIAQASRTWYDTERDRFGYVRDCIRCRSIFPRGTKPIFPFLGHGDMSPLGASFQRNLQNKLRGGLNLVKRSIGHRRS